MIYHAFTQQGLFGKGQWDLLLPDIIETYNDTPHSAHGYTPNEVWDDDDDGQIVRNAGERMLKTNKSLVARTNKQARLKLEDINVGDYVRRHLNKRLTRELASVADRTNAKPLDKNMNITFSKHSYVHQWTRQIYRVTGIVNEENTNTVMTPMVHLEKIPPYIDSRHTKVNCMEYVTNLLKVTEENMARCKFDLQLPTNPALREPLYIIPQEKPTFVKGGEEWTHCANAAVNNMKSLHKISAAPLLPEEKKEAAEKAKMQTVRVPKREVQGRVPAAVVKPFKKEEEAVEPAIPDRAEEDAEEAAAESQQPVKEVKEEPPRKEKESRPLDEGVTEGQRYGTPNQPGPRKIPGWMLEDVEGDGNCFFRAVAEQLNTICKENPKEPLREWMPWDHKKVRQVSQGDLKHLGTDADFTDIQKVSECLKVIIAIAPTLRFWRKANGEQVSQKPFYMFYWQTQEGEFTYSNKQEDLPKWQPIVRLAFTGGHYMVVTKEEEEFRIWRSYLRLQPLPAGVKIKMRE